MNVGFFTHISDHLIESYGARKLINSLKYFHPEIPLHVFGTKELNEEFSKDPWQNWLTINPIMALRIVDNYDLLVHFDADSMVTGRLDELLKADYEVAGVRNNNDLGTAGCFTYPLDKAHKWIDGKIECTCKIDTFKYLNAGLVASTNKKFWYDWAYYNKVFNARSYYFGEQDVLNILLNFTNKYQLKILDAVDVPLYYGLANSYGVNNHWESWASIIVKNDELYLNDKKIKVLHHAGGSDALPKLGYDKFSTEVANFLRKITQIQ